MPQLWEAGSDLQTSEERWVSVYPLFEEGGTRVSLEERLRVCMMCGYPLYPGEGCPVCAELFDIDQDEWDAMDQYAEETSGQL